jgi:hypothetical protein
MTHCSLGTRKLKQSNLEAQAAMLISSGGKWIAQASTASLGAPPQKTYGKTLLLKLTAT